MSSPSPIFAERFRAELLQLFEWRRDVRRFRRDKLPDGALERLLEIACAAPSVGLSQPWRFVVVEDEDRRAQIRDAFSAGNADALAAYSGDAALSYAGLKLAGLGEAPCQVAIFADRDTVIGRGLGRQTMPETIEYSVVGAIHTLWLAARAEGIGMGWVSILDPALPGRILDVPPAWRFIGYFCLGYPLEADNVPELEREGWERRRDPASFIIRR